MIAVFGEKEEQLEGNALHFNQLAGAPKLEGAWIEFEVFEMDDFLKHGGPVHRATRFYVFIIRT